MKSEFVIDDTFWSRYQELVADVMLPYQYQVLQDSLQDPEIEKSHSIENFRIAAGESHGEFYGQVFQDSDTYKWLEAVAYTIQNQEDRKSGETSESAKKEAENAPNNYKKVSLLESRADELIDLIGRTQQKDGYLNTYFTVKRPQEKWTNLQEGHELYCAGHMLEAAVAYSEATGKHKFLAIARKNADLLCQTFLQEYPKGIPGHPEVELALVRLARLTGEEKYLKLAKHFIDQRGMDPTYFAREKAKRTWTVWNMGAEQTDYAQNTNPVRTQQDAVGHAVRAVYLYTGMAMVARETKDASLLTACKRMWDSITEKQMYLTGGIGSTANGEAFTLPYDLPNDTAYSETCAAIGLIFFAKEMVQMSHDARYTDVLEQALYNNVLAGIQLDGTRFLYANPLEVDPEYAGKIPAVQFVRAVRPKWYPCACCPPNAARLLASLNRYAWHLAAEKKKILYADLFMGGIYQDSSFAIHVKTDYPFSGVVQYTIERMEEDGVLAIRQPYWSRRTDVLVNGEKKHIQQVKGYLHLENLKAGDSVEIHLDMTAHLVYANTKVTADFCKCAIMRGPLVYCMEDTDNEGNINTLVVDANAGTTDIVEKEYFDRRLLRELPLLQIPAYRIKNAESDGEHTLYSSCRPVRESATITALPYYAWGNRGKGRMKVWIPYC